MSDWTHALASVSDQIGEWLEAIRVALGAECAHLWVLERESERLSLYLVTPEDAAQLVPDAVPIAGHALSWAVSEGVTLRASRADVFRGGDEGWIVAVPVTEHGGDRVACVVMEFAHAPGAHAPRALELAVRLAGRLVADARAGLAARADMEKNEALYGTVHDLERQLDLGGLTREVCARARRVAGARAAVLALWDAGRGHGRVVAIDGELDQSLLHA